MFRDGPCSRCRVAERAASGLLPNSRLYESESFTRTDGLLGVVAFVDAHLHRLLDHGRRFRPLRQSLQVRAGRRLRPGHRAAQHLSVGAGRYLRLYVRRAADDRGDARLRRAVRDPHGPGGPLHAGLHERPHAAGLPGRGRRREPRSGAAAGRPARSVERSAAHVRDRRRGDRRGTGYRRAPAGHYGRYGHRGDAAAEVRGHQVFDGHLPGRRVGGAGRPGRDRLRTGHRRGCSSSSATTMPS